MLFISIILLSFLGTKQISVCKFEKEKSTDNSNSTNNKWKNQEEILKNEESIAESGRIFIRNLSYTTTEDDIQELFSKYGKHFTYLNFLIKKLF